MANKKVSQLVSKPSVLVTDLFPIADPSTGQLFKTTISALGTAIGSGVSSVNTLVGAVVLDTDDIQELVSPTNKWYTDTRSRAAISGGVGISYNSGTGVITNAVTSGLIATALGYTPADDALVVKLAGAQTITGTKTFNQAPLLDLGAGFKNSNGVYNYLQSLVTGWQVPVNGQNHNLIFSTLVNYVYTFPNASGTIALTSDLHNAVTIGTANGLSLSTQVLSLGLSSSIANGALSSTDWTTFNAKQSALNGTGFVKITGTTISYDNSVYVKGSGTSTYLAAWSATANTLTNSLVSTFGNITTVEGMGLSTLNGLDIQGNYGAGGGGQKIRSFDETTGNAYIDFANTGGRFYLGVNKSTSGGLMTNATAYATVLTTALGTTNLEIGTNATKRMTIDGSTGAVTLTSALSAVGSLTGSALYVTGMTAGSGALYHTASRLTLANYNVNGILYFEVNGGVNALTLNANLSATFASTLSATGATLTGALSGTSATFSGGVNASQSVFTHASTPIRLNNLGGQFTQLDFLNNNTQKGAIWWDNTANSLNLWTGTTALTIASTGAATFSSSVTATSIMATDATGSAILTTNGGGEGVLSVNTANPLRLLINGGEKMRITSAGNVGIGTTSPSFATGAGLAVFAPSQDARFALKNTASGDTATDGFQLVLTTALEAVLENRENGSMRFLTNATEAMRITAAGNVLIGKTSGNSKFAIVGLPTSSVGLAAGDVYVTAGALMIV